MTHTLFPELAPPAVDTFDAEPTPIAPPAVLEIEHARTGWWVAEDVVYEENDTWRQRWATVYRFPVAWQIVGQYGRTGGPTGRTCIDCGRDILEGECVIHIGDAVNHRGYALDSGEAERAARRAVELFDHPDASLGVYHLRCRPDMLRDGAWRGTSAARRKRPTEAEIRSGVGLKTRTQPSLVKCYKAPRFIFRSHPLLVDHARKVVAGEAPATGAIWKDGGAQLVIDLGTVMQ